MADFALQRRMMVDCQLRTYDVTSAALLAAMDETPRELFLDPEQRSFAYVDRPLTVQAPGGGRRAMLTPMVFARLVQAAKIGPEDRVLDVACGTGYSSAVLAQLAGSVVALESDQGLAARASELLGGVAADRVTVTTGALKDGHAAGAPYDVIVVNGAFEVEPTALFSQLRDGGRLVGVFGAGRAAKAMVYLKSGDVIGGRAIFDAAAPLLDDFKSAQTFVF